MITVNAEHVIQTVLIAYKVVTMDALLVVLMANVWEEYAKEIIILMLDLTHA